MDDLIRRKDAIEIFSERAKSLQDIYGDLGGACSGALKIIKAIPSAEPEQKKGKWLWDEEEDRCFCSECGEEDDLSIDGVYMMHDFCPNCGADMK